MALDNLRRVSKALEDFDLKSEQEKFILEHKSEIEAMLTQGKTKEEIQKDFLYPALNKICIEKTGFGLTLTEN